VNERTLSLPACERALTLGALALALAACSRAEPVVEPAKEEASALPTLEQQAVHAPRIQQALARRTASDDEAWESEALHERCKKALNALAQVLEAGSELESTIVHPEFVGTRLRPHDLAQTKGTRDVTVRRGAAGEPQSRDLAQELSALRAHFVPDSVHVKFKIVEINTTAAGATNRVSCALYGRAAKTQRPLQAHADWHVEWSATPDAVRLRRLEVQHYEEVEAATFSEPLYADRTASLFTDVPWFEAQLAPGLEHWLGTIDMSQEIGLFGHHGLALGDIDGDGRDDIYLCQPSGLPNRMLRQREDGTLEDISERSRTDFIERGRGALILDLDNDGDRDLVVTVAAEVVFMENDGEARFSVRDRHPLVAAYGLAAADYDNDGLLDVYACAYKTGGSEGGVPLPYHDANNGDPNVLLRNAGDWTFADVTRSVGLDANNTRFSFAASWMDYDRDGDADLYVANDFGRNNLYRNTDGKFEDVSAAAGVEDISAGMSVSWGDFDQDGWPDLYVSNMFSSAGKRVAYQRQFQSAAREETREQLQRHARGNSLFRNRGDGTFEDISVQAGVTMGRWAWGSRFVDMNNDGLEDVVIGNGFITNDDTDDL